MAAVSYQTAASGPPAQLERTENMELNADANHVSPNVGLLACIVGCVCVWAVVGYALVAVLS
ncbi:MAG TPA: hypothetical protein VGI77_12805 [Gaiellaceae bacterium]